MLTLPRFTKVALGLMGLFCIVPGLAGQSSGDGFRPTYPGFSSLPPLDVHHVPSLSSNPVLVMPNASAASAGRATDANGDIVPYNSREANVTSSAKFGLPWNGLLFGLNTLPLFEGAFSATGGPSGGKVFPFIVVGRNPQLGDTTHIPANITAVSVELLNADGSVFKTVAVDPFVQRTLDSPNFKNFDYTNGDTQFADAVQRAEFKQVMDEGWHTKLVPSVVNRVTIQVPFFVNVQLANGNVVQARSYFTGTAADGSTFILMLSPLFNFFFDNAVVNDINLGNYSTKAMNMQLWPNTFLFSLNVSNPNVPGGCCTLGFHTYFYDGNSSPQSRWVTSFQSWISPGIFGGGFQDITALSHETSEAFNDPFVNTAVPSWQFPGQPANSKVCQGNLETGDPIEVLAAATFPVTLTHDGKAFTYHPQNEALLQWFSQGPTSNAFQGAFSYPDTTVLPTSAVPCPQ